VNRARLTYFRTRLVWRRATVQANETLVGVRKRELVEFWSELPAAHAADIRSRLFGPEHES